MSDFRDYKNYMDQVHAPASLYTEVWNMTIDKNNKPVRRYRRPLLTLAAIMILLLALTLTAYALGPSLFGWGGNFEVRRGENGELMEAVLHTDSLTEPVRFEGGRMIFIVNDEELDITDEVSETKAFTYEFTGDEGITHCWIIGKNGPEPTHYGYGEFLRSEAQGWISGYTARVNLDPDSKGPAWLESGKEKLGIPW